MFEIYGIVRPNIEAFKQRFIDTRMTITKIYVHTATNSESVNLLNVFGEGWLSPWVSMNHLIVILYNLFQSFSAFTMIHILFIYSKRVNNLSTKNIKSIEFQYYYRGKHYSHIESREYTDTIGDNEKLFAPIFDANAVKKMHDNILRTRMSNAPLIVILSNESTSIETDITEQFSQYSLYYNVNELSINAPTLYQLNLPNISKYDHISITDNEFDIYKRPLNKYTLNTKITELLSNKTD